MELANRLQKTSYINPKDSVVEGLKQKIKLLGNLTTPIEVTKTYPARESFEGTAQGTVRPKRLIVVKKLNGSKYKGGIGDTISSNYAEKREERYVGWMEAGTYEISVWSSDSSDRDTIMTLLKIWMLELAHEIENQEHTFFSKRGIVTANYMREYEEINSNIIRNGVMYIGVLVYDIINVFEFLTIHDKEEVIVELVEKLNSNILI